uniref:Uncharacterized protein n=1 Tax=Cannabis sativa TaxID=3483 RepID=A0A803QTB9_CANSA
MEDVVAVMARSVRLFGGKDGSFGKECEDIGGRDGSFGRDDGSGGSDGLGNLGKIFGIRKPF